ncbi:hypothetical protein B1L11_25365 [Microbispora sp. GKU 823]|nr:hypothetical protein B1L11_25365 [Microbispora sp. GKU 823]
MALDAALLSPNGTAVAVDEEGRVRGVAGRDAIDELLAEYAPPAAGPARGGASGSGGGSSSGAGDSEGAPA